MSIQPTEPDWLELGLDELPNGTAQRVRLLRQLLAAANLARGRLDRLLAPAGITSQQAAMLQLIEAQAQAPTISLIAQLMAMTHQNVKQIASALQRKGFLDIVVDPADRRARRLMLTRYHKRFWQTRNPRDFSYVHAWTAGLSDAETAVAARLLTQLRLHMRSQGDDNV